MIKKPANVNTITKTAVFQIRGSLNLIPGAIIEALAAITVIRHILAKGSNQGQISAGIFPLLISFTVTPKNVGTTIINKRETAILLPAIAIFAPINNETLPGTTRGASRVSSRINVNPRAISPLKIETHIKPETAVGPENKRIKPEVTSLLTRNREETAMAKTGITIWAAKKNNSMGEGLLIVVPNCLKRSFNAPENVIIPKRAGTKERKCIKKEGSKKPITIASGVVMGISRSRT
jgi:hypothetical protein